MINGLKSKPRTVSAHVLSFNSCSYLKNDVERGSTHSTSNAPTACGQQEARMAALAQARLPLERLRQRRSSHAWPAAPAHNTTVQQKTMFPRMRGFRRHGRQWKHKGGRRLDRDWAGGRWGRKPSRCLSLIRSGGVAGLWAGHMVERPKAHLYPPTPSKKKGETNTEIWAVPNGLGCADLAKDYFF